MPADTAVDKSLDFHFLFESLPGMFAVLSPDGAIVALSDAYLAALGKKRDEVLGLTLFEVFSEATHHQQDSASNQLRESLARVRETGRADTLPVQRFELTCSRDSKWEERYWRITNSPFAQHGQLAYFIHQVEEVTELIRLEQKLHQESDEGRSSSARKPVAEMQADKKRKLTEQALRESEQRYATLVEALPHLVWTTLPNGDVDYLNHRWQEYTGVETGQLLEWGWQSVIHPDDLQNTLKHWTHSLRSGDPLETKHRIRNKNGEYRWFCANGIPLRDDQGRVLKWFGTNSDIDGQERIQREREQLLAVGSDLLAVTDLDGVFKWLSPNWEAVLGWTVDEIKARGWLYFVHPDDREKSINEGKKLAQGREIISFENRQLCKSGNYKWIEWATKPSLKEKLLYCRASDITERKEAMEALRESGERFRAAVTASGTGTFRWNIVFNTLEWDESLDRLCGLPPSMTPRTLGNFVSLVHPEERAGVIERCQRCAREGTDFDMEFRVIWPDGSVHWLYDKGKTFRDAEGRPSYMTGACVDITERKGNEEALRSSQLRLSSIYEVAPVGIAEVGLDGKFLNMNARYHEILGYSKEELLQHTFQDVTHPDEVAADVDLYQQLQTGEIGTYTIEKRYLHKDGRVIWVSLHVALIRDDRGKPLFGVAAIQDITQRRQTETELHAAQEKLSYYATDLEKLVAERTNKLKETVTSLEDLSYTIAHDLRAPLRAMEGFSSALLEEYAGRMDDTGRHYLSRIKMSARRMDTLIQELLAYGRLNHLEIPLTSVSLGEVIDNVLTAQSGDIQNKHALVEVVTPLPSVLANATILEQAIGNLVGNALKFVKPGTSPEIRISAEEKDGKAKIFVTDKGIGIDPRFQNRIFRVFERINVKQYPGTGIGLAIVQKSAERMGGSSGVQSEPGKGSTFWIELPSVQK
jgi:PAS domain S-box-containing protein